MKKYSLFIVLAWATWFTGAFTGCKNQPILMTPTHMIETGADGPANKQDTQALFADVGKQAGLNYRWTVEGKRPLNILQTIGNGCAFLDFDNDGNLDILLVGPRIALYRGDGHGHFTDISAKVGLNKLSGHFLGCAVGDYDNDGFEDIYISAYRGGILLHNDKGQSFVDVTQAMGIPPQPWGTSCSFVDVDNDGKLDLYICNYAVFGPDTQPQLCNFNGILSSCGPRFYAPEKGRLYRNEGSRFREVIAQMPSKLVNGRALGVAAADFDGSGRQSLAVANDEMPGDLLLNRNGNFSNIGVLSATAYDAEGSVHGGMGVDWGDYDNDGKLDLVVATFQRENKCVYHNDGNNLFTEVSSKLGVAPPCMPYVSFGVKFFDFDNDGFLDLIFADGHVQDNIQQVENAHYQQPAVLLHNLGGTRFEDVTAQGGAAFRKGIVGRGLAVGDFDNDGRLDVLLVDSEGEPLLLHNQNPQSSHWLSVRLEGVESNRDGIGALVTLEANGKTQMRRCATDGSYLSASDRRIHFGLARSTNPITVRVRWPGGRAETFSNITPDQIVTLRQGRGAPSK